MSRKLPNFFIENVSMPTLLTGPDLFLQKMVWGKRFLLHAQMKKAGQFEEKNEKSSNLRARKKIHKLYTMDSLGNLISQTCFVGILSLSTRLNKGKINHYNVCKNKYQ